VAIPLWRFGAITGAVVDEHGDPLVGVPVRALRRAIQSGRTQFIAGPQDTTDDRGIYRLGGLEPADYVVVVPMQRGSSVNVEGLMAGDNIRVVEAQMVATRAAAAGGGGDFTFVSAESSGGAGTDANGRSLTYPTMFYPTALAATQAQIVTIGSGDDRTAIDFQLRGVPAITVSGTAVSPNGPAANLQIALTPADAEHLAISVETITGFSDGQGRFTIAGVPSGRYILRASLQPRITAQGIQEVTAVQGGGVMVTRTMAGPAPLPTEPVYWAEVNLPVGNTDISDLTISLQPGAKVSGLVRFEGGAQRPDDQAVRAIPVRLEPADVRPGLALGRGLVESTGQFTTMGVPAGRYFLRVAGAPSGWYFQSATVGGRDASIMPIDLQTDTAGVVITFTDRPSVLSGQVDTGGVDEAASVLAFPTDRTLWEGYGSAPRNLVSVRADREGKYRFENLPAGDYYVAAVPDKDAGDWQDPRVLARLAPTATRVRVNAGDKVEQQVRIIR
jgi:hypothetical protein